VQVTLVKQWTDSQGVTHPVGSTIDVDAVTLAQLEPAGYVGPAGEAVNYVGQPGTDEAGPPGPPNDEDEW
jgi:hypothetical protein